MNSPSPCVRCHKSHSSPHAFLLECAGCRRAWHHVCHVPPVTEDDIFARIAADDAQNLAEGLAAWKCRRCVKKGSVKTEPPVQVPAPIPRSDLATNTAIPVPPTSYDTRNTPSLNTASHDHATPPSIVHAGAHMGLPPKPVKSFKEPELATPTRSDLTTMREIDFNHPSFHSKTSRVDRPVTLAGRPAPGPPASVVPGSPNAIGHHDAHAHQSKPKATASPSDVSASTYRSRSASHSTTPAPHSPTPASSRRDMSSTTPVPRSPTPTSSRHDISSTTPTLPSDPSAGTTKDKEQEQPDLKALIANMRASGKLAPPPVSYAMEMTTEDEPDTESDTPAPSASRADKGKAREERPLGGGADPRMSSHSSNDGWDDMYGAEAPPPRPPIPQLGITVLEDKYAGMEKGTRDALDRVLQKITQVQITDSAAKRAKPLAKHLGVKARRRREDAGVNFAVGGWVRGLRNP